MAQTKKTKEIAQRIDPTYFRHWHRLRRTRFLLSVGLFIIALVWVGGAYALGAKRMYANGPILTAHEFVEEQCDKCHTEGFGPVYDGSCLQCHVVGGHDPQGGDPDCGTCHAEHRGDVVIEDGHCNACHTDHSAITDFAGHIRFQPPRREQDLRFNHEKHLDEKLLEGPLDCGSCHVPKGRNFAPIGFDVHCARCHAERVSAEITGAVPHGLPRGELRDWVAGVFLRAAQTRFVFRGPNSVPGAATGPPPSWIGELDESIDAAMDSLFTPGRGCLICHLLDDDKNIAVPAIPDNWLPRARFDHKTHRFESCERCHDLQGNTQAEDLSLPEVATCRTCHRAGGAPTACVSCHPYHATGDKEAWR